LPKNQPTLNFIDFVQTEVALAGSVRETVRFVADRPVMREEHVLFRVSAVACADAGN
jgi:hypothetical protein